MIADEEDLIKPSPVWTAISKGLLSGAYDVSRINRAIDQAFEQSPYLSIECIICFIKIVLVIWGYQ